MTKETIRVSLALTVNVRYRERDKDKKGIGGPSFFGVIHNKINKFRYTQLAKLSNYI